MFRKRLGIYAALLTSIISWSMPTSKCVFASKEWSDSRGATSTLLTLADEVIE